MSKGLTARQKQFIRFLKKRYRNKRDFYSYIGPPSIGKTSNVRKVLKETD